MADSKKWFIRRSGQVRGPFPYSILAKLARLGRLKLTDELSYDKENWKAARDYSELFSQLDAGLLLKDDERSGLDRREKDLATNNSPNSQNNRQKKDRRKPESEEEVTRRRGRTSLLKAIREKRVKDHFPYLTIIVSLVLIILLGFVLRPSPGPLLSDCSAPPEALVNWDNCKFGRLILRQKDLSRASIRNAVLSRVDLQGAVLVESNFSYTDLSRANLKNARLDKAILIGANLKSANLTSASLQEADLSHADLRGAKLENTDLRRAILDKAIWKDGSLCANGSVGLCRTR